MGARGSSPGRTANEQFKRRHTSRIQAGLLVAVGFHQGLFVLVKPFEAADLGTVVDEIESVALPPEVRIPPPPEQIARPATPRVATVDVSEDVTIAPTTFEEFDPDDALPPPPETGNVADRPAFIPYDTPPALQNREEVRELLKRYYPVDLREAGIRGTVVLWIYVNEQGRVERSEVRESSGSPLLDDAAGRVVADMRFSPARNREKVTAVWVSQAVTFAAR